MPGLHPPRLVNGEHGLSLIEILVAFTILSIAGIALFKIGSTSITGNTKTADQVVAGALASAKLEDLRNTDYDSLASGSDGPLTAGGASGGMFTRTWTITSTPITGVSNNVKTAAVSVSWTGGGPVTMTTMIVKPAQVLPDFGSGFPTAAVKSMEQTK